MLGVEHPLYFPKLIQEGCCHLKHRDEHVSVENILRLFRLDWSQQEANIMRKHAMWLQSQHPGKIIPCLGGLPEPYNKQLNTCIFAISDDYLKEIRYHTREGLAAWNRNLRFDTIIREECLGPGISHIRVSFALLADCLYDPDNQYWDRSDFKQILKYIMAIKFWFYQTGRGMAFRHAGLEELEDNVERTKGYARNDGEPISKGLCGFIQEGRDFLDAMTAHRDAIYRTYDPLVVRDDDGSLIEPSPA